MLDDLKVVDEGVSLVNMFVLTPASSIALSEIGDAEYKLRPISA